MSKQPPADASAGQACWDPAADGATGPFVQVDHRLVNPGEAVGFTLVGADVAQSRLEVFARYLPVRPAAE